MSKIIARMNVDLEYTGVHVALMSYMGLASGGKFSYMSVLHQSSLSSVSYPEIRHSRVEDTNSSVNETPNLN